MAPYLNVERGQWFHILGPATFCVSITWLILSVPPGLHWHDTAEFTAVGHRLSVSHPPGHPIHAMLTYLSERTPLGSVYVRAHVLSALLLSLALVIFGRVLKRIAPRLSPLTVFCFSILPLFMTSIWLQGIRSEVYALQIFLTALLAWLLCLIRTRRDGRDLCLLSLVFGFAGANHSLLGLMWVPLAALVVIWRRYPLKTWLSASLCGLLGLSAYAYLPLRATAGGEVGWGQPDTLGRLWEMISAREWSRSVQSPHHSDAWDTISTLAEYGVMQFGIVGTSVLLVVAIAAVIGITKSSSKMALALCYLAVIPFAFRLLYEPDILNPDLGGYLALGFLAAFALLCLGLDALRITQHRFLDGAMICMLIAAGLSMDRGGRHDARSADRFARQLLEETPPDGVLVYSDYASYFQGWALRAVEAARPDVVLLFRGQIRRPWFQRRIVDTYPQMGDRLANFPSSFSGNECRFEPGVRMEQFGVFGTHLRPIGLTLSFDAPWPKRQVVDAAFSVFRDADDDGQRNGAFQSALHAQLLLAQNGPQGLIDYHLHRLETLAGDDDWFIRLKASSEAKTR